LYEPINKEFLIQKSGRTFTIFFIPEFEQKTIKICWELLARDFDKIGVIEVQLEPKYKEVINYIKVDKKLNFKEDLIEIKKLIEEKK
jgi:hypothetical protein